MLSECIVAMWTVRKDAVELCTVQQVCVPSCCSRLYLVMLSEWQQLNSATIPDWCPGVLEEGLDSVPYTKIHRGALVLVSEDLRTGMRPIQKRIKAGLHLIWQFCSQIVAWNNIRLMITFAMGYSVHHVRASLRDRRWFRRGLEVLLLLATIAVLA